MVSHSSLIQDGRITWHLDVLYDHLIAEIQAFAKLEWKRTWGPYKRRDHIGDERSILIVEDMNGKRRTKSYPKYLMEMHLGRELDVNESIDHIDYDISNNDLSNLQVIDRKEHSALDTRRVKLENFNCVECGKSFQRSPRLIRDKAKKGKTGPFCSRSCSARHARKVQTGKAERAPIQQHMPSTYYRRKQMQEHASKMAAKYANDIAKLG
jgi:hypothetical protein